jgi:hypothetical protein
MEEMLPCTFTPRINPKILKSPPKVKVEQRSLVKKCSSVDQNAKAVSD